MIRSLDDSITTICCRCTGVLGGRVVVSVVQKGLVEHLLRDLSHDYGSLQIRFFETSYA